MTPMSAATATHGQRRAARALIAIAVTCFLTAASGCGTGHPRPITAGELAEAQTFPFYRLYWVGPRFLGHPIVSVDGLKSYLTSVGDSVYYGDCVRSKGIFGGGSCLLPLQVTTVIYRRHVNDTLGSQRNMLIRGVPAVVYDGGRSIELYSGRLAIDIFSDRYTHALAAAQALRPVNAPGSATGNLPPPVYCPGLSREIGALVWVVMDSLPGHICQRSAGATAFAKALTE
jgi:hypothetical protein